MMTRGRSATGLITTLPWRNKRLEEGVFRFPMVRNDDDCPRVEMRAAEFMMLLDGVDLTSVKRQKRYRRPAVTAAQSG